MRFCRGRCHPVARLGTVGPADADVGRINWRSMGACTGEALVRRVLVSPRVLDLENSQPEVKLTYAQYLARTVTDQRVAQGRELLAQYRPLLEKVSAAYRVQPQYIVALWGVESDYGRVTGGYPVIGSLATLA